MGIVLSCNDYNDAVLSLALAYMVNIEDVQRVLGSWALDPDFNEEIIITGLHAEFGGVDHNFGSAIFYHRSICVSREVFLERGLLDSKSGAGMFLNDIKNIMEQEDFDAVINYSMMKLNHRFSYEGEKAGGPHAFLSKEQAINACVSGLDYRIPEFFSDYLESIDHGRSKIIRNKIEEIMRPCVVCFVVQPDSKDDYIIGLVKYLIFKKTDGDLADACFYGFNGRGKGVSPRNLVSVEFI